MTPELKIPGRPEDWADCHAGPLTPPDLSAREAFRRGLSAAPKWVTPAMLLRNLIVKPFGLQTAAGQKSSGVEFLGKLPVLEDRDDLFETGMTDKHLTFTLRVETEPGHVAVRTRIWFHSDFGRFYLRVVLPAHNAILRTMIGALGEAA